MFLFFIIILQRGLYSKMSKGAFALLSAGTIMVFCAGFFKVTWNLLYAAGVCDFEKLSLCFMPMQTTGFFLVAMNWAAEAINIFGQGMLLWGILGLKKA